MFKVLVRLALHHANLKLTKDNKTSKLYKLRKLNVCKYNLRKSNGVHRYLLKTEVLFVAIKSI